jgi:hypothetical protein
VIDRDYGLGSGGSRSLIHADDGSTERGVEKSCVHFTAWARHVAFSFF